MRRAERPYVVVVAGVLLAVGVLVVVGILLPADSRQDLLFEVAKAAVSVIPLAFLGVIVADLIRRRDADKAASERDQEARRDLRLRAIGAYNQTKATRRILRAAGLRPDAGSTFDAQLLEKLDEQMAALSGAQLTFEELKREMRAPRAPFDQREAIEGSLESLEKMYNRVIRDWERGRPGLAPGMEVATLASWPAYAVYVAEPDVAREGADPAGEFRRVEEAFLRDLGDGTA